jgi:hypothetical protein
VSRASLRESALKSAALVDALSADFAKELAQTLKLLTAKIRQLTKQFEVENGQIVRTAANLARALSMRAQVEAALEEAGYLDLMQRATGTPLDDVAEAALLTRAGKAAAKLSAYDAEALVALKELRLAELLDVGEDVAATVWRATVDGVLGGQSRETLIEDLADLIDETEADTRTLYDTAVSTYSRQVHLLHSDGSPDERFIYLGPDDEVTRPFCREHLNETLTRAEVESLDNGQLPNPLLTGGGYQCRHQWLPVGLEDAGEGGEAQAA